MAAMTVLPLAATGVALAGWLLLLAVLAVRTRNPRVTPGPPTSELGTESPAVVDLITGDWRLSDEAAPGTLLDLAARGVVRVEEIGPELSLVRLGNRLPAAGLTDYEKLVHQRVRRLARDGVVATAALAEGQRDVGRWSRGFRRRVVAEARRLGLSRQRWSRAQVTILALAAAFPALGAAWAAWTVTSDSDDAWGAAGVVALAVLLLLTALNGERGTPAGAAAAGRWLGVRAHLAGNPRLADAPAAAVTVWGRHLAYAAVCGLARRAVASLPVGRPADDRRAWSDYGGMWHAVHVRYPKRWGTWGITPGQAIGRAVIAFLPAASLGLLAFALLDAFAGWDVDPLSLGLLCGGCVAAVLIGFAVSDLASRSAVTGQVVRLRRIAAGERTYTYWLALDTGQVGEVVAYGIDSAEFDALVEGDVVRARLGRRLGRVDQVDVLVPSRHRAPVAGEDEALPEAPRNAAETLLGEWRGGPRTRRRTSG